MNELSNRLAYLVLIPCLLLVFSSCNTSRKLAVSKKVPEKSETKDLLEQLAQNQVQADWLSARLKLNYEDDYNSVSARGSLKMRKDSIIWMNIKKLEYEAARILITTDSIYILDRLNKQYTIKDLNYVQRTYNLPASLTSIQALILGNPVFFNPSTLQLEKEELSYHLYGNDDRMESHYWINMAGLMLNSMMIDDYRNGRKLDYELLDYGQMTDNQNFSYIRRLEMNTKEMGQLSVGVKFSKVEINIPKSIRFEIPERYTRID